MTTKIQIRANIWYKISVYQYAGGKHPWHIALRRIHNKGIVANEYLGELRFLADGDVSRDSEDFPTKQEAIGALATWLGLVRSVNR